jgi:lysophospholipase L1-like esterase
MPGVSGDTTSGGLARLDWSIPDGIDGVILELGANDALRGLPPEKTRENLEAMIVRLKQRGITVLLAGMLAPPNMGAGYETVFNQIYPDLAAKHDLIFYPFFLDGVTGNPEMLCLTACIRMSTESIRWSRSIRSGRRGIPGPDQGRVTALALHLRNIWVLAWPPVA